MAEPEAFPVRSHTADGGDKFACRESQRDICGHSRSIIMVGAFPPPTVGLAVINAAVRDALLQAGAEPLIIDLAAPSLNRSLGARLGRLPKVISGLVRLACARVAPLDALYMSLSAGLGQVYELAFIALARRRGMHLFLHHHCFAYLDAPSRLTRLLLRLAGRNAVHITQSASMAERLQRVYGAQHLVSVSNAVFLPPANAQPLGRETLNVIGFISNISAEKGVFDFLDLCVAGRNKQVPFRALLAGPFQDADTERTVRKRLAALPNVEYVGARYGEEKVGFFSSIDVLVFPTRYENETEGIVNHEAMSRGIPVIAYGRGCIPEIVGAECGLVVDPARPFVPAALAQIEAWQQDSSAFAAASRAAAQQFSRTLVGSERHWRALLNNLTGKSDASLLVAEEARSSS